MSTWNLANLLNVFGWGGWSASVLRERAGKQETHPATGVVPGLPVPSADTALQLDTVWACVDRRATTIASLPLFVYEQRGSGQRDLARTSRLYALLHDSPNARMTPFDFWRAMLLYHDLRGNAYARIDRDDRTGEAIALWPLPPDQVETFVLDDGSMWYSYRSGDVVSVINEGNVLHLRNLGTGTMGLDKISFMRAGLSEANQQVTSASQMWGNSGKPTGILQIDQQVDEKQRKAILARYAGLTTGAENRLHLLEGFLKYQPISITPEQQQLLESRRHSVESLCRWYDVPPVLVHHANVTTWGSGIAEIADGFHKFTLRPLCVSIEQAIKKRVLTPRQRATMSAEFNMDALLRASLKDRMGIYATAVQNGIMSRNECRQLENTPPDPAPVASQLTAQSNLVPLDKLGIAISQGQQNASVQTTVAQ